MFPGTIRNGLHWLFLQKFWQVGRTKIVHISLLASGNQTWRAEKWTIEIGLGIFQPAIFDETRSYSSHKIPWNHHFPMVVLCFSYGFRMVFLRFSPTCRTEATQPFSTCWWMASAMTCHLLGTLADFSLRLGVGRAKHGRFLPTEKWGKTIGKWWLHGILWDE